MRRLFATLSNFACVPSHALLGASTIALATLFGQFQAAALPAGILHTSICDAEDASGNMPGGLASGDMLCPAHPRPSTEIAEARAYLIETASPGFTMSKQGPELAIERLHPEFTIRLANAIREAREAGLPSVGVFSAYRPPAFGIGGFSDKFNSLHAYGLAVYMAGIGGPGSRFARLWQTIVGKVGLYLPYGPNNRAEFNHTQLVPTKMASAFLRRTITASEPKDLQQMWLASGITSYVSDVMATKAPALASASTVQHALPAEDADRHDTTPQPAAR